MPLFIEAAYFDRKASIFLIIVACNGDFLKRAFAGVAMQGGDELMPVLLEGREVFR
ncbi:hypothetical protein [Noviherbaspirillum malthae]|uniref:hypothetical protein n=1 Tax=Noviherbaspirillum malthae TaxID=1260987 RepID=UPI00188F5E06|nr:hypothetical protein [Noviherbaspirillum malthae]